MKRVTAVTLLWLAGCGSTDGAAPSLVGPGPEAPVAAAPVAVAQLPEAVEVSTLTAPSVTAPPQADEVAPAARGLETVELDPAVGGLSEQLFLQASKARSEGKRVYLEMSATWCPPCKRMHALLSEPDVAASLEGVVIIRADSDAFGRDLYELGFTSRTIPAVYEIDKRGRPSGRRLQGHAWKTAQAVRDALPAFLRG